MNQRYILLLVALGYLLVIGVAIALVPAPFNLLVAGMILLKALLFVTVMLRAMQKRQGAAPD